MYLGHDQFLMHLANRDESELAQNIDDVKNNKWVLTTTAMESQWSTSFKIPAGSKGPLLTRTKTLQNTQLVSVSFFFVPSWI